MMSRDDPTRRSFEPYTGAPMTLGNMRHNRVRTLDAWCLARGCNHHHLPLPGAASGHLACARKPDGLARALPNNVGLLKFG